jgi:hypothetical protein
LTETSAKVSLLSRFKIIMIKIVRRAWWCCSKKSGCLQSRINASKKRNANS